MEYPQPYDIVIVKVTQVLDYGAFCELMEYNNIRGFVHISNVSTSWVKNIRNHVKMNQVRAAKVLNVDFAKGQIDISFAGVTPQRERQKLTEFKQFNREEKIIAILAKSVNKKPEDLWPVVIEPLAAEYGSFYEALEKISLGEDVSSVVDKEWVAPLKELVEKNIVVSKKTIKGSAKVTSLASDGLADVQHILSEVAAVKGCEVHYMGAGAYAIAGTAATFKEADKLVTKAVAAAEGKAKKLGATFEFKKEETA